VPDLLARGKEGPDLEALGSSAMRFLTGCLTAMVLACAPGPESGPRLDSSTTAGSPAADSAATCLVAAQSVLARGAGTATTVTAGVHGWIRLEAFAVADSSAARLVDSDGFSLDAAWRRQRPDSLVVSAFNDFVRVEMRLQLADSGVRGTMTAHSDAALERTSTGALSEFRRSRTIDFRRAPCDSMPSPVAGAAIDVLPHATPRSGIRFDPPSLRSGMRVGDLIADSVAARRTVADSSFVGIARFRGQIELSGWTLRNPDPDLHRILTCFEADSASAARLPRWAGDERRAWFCFTNRAEAARALGPPSEGVRATIVVDEFTIHRGLSDEVNSARLVRLVRGGMRG